MLLLFTACADETLPLGVPRGDTTTTETVPSGSTEDTVDWVPCAGDPVAVLNEALAANVQGDADEDGDRGDWLEIAARDAPVNLDGWWLSQDGTPEWQIPAIPLAADEVLRVWATGKDRADPAAPLHASFRLDTTGDTLFLHMPDGCVADHVVLPRMYADESYGRAADGSWEWFLAPTPGAPNTTESRPGFAPTPTISPEGGFYAGDATISGEGTLRYTLDGSPPDEDDPEVTGPIAVHGDVPLRARAFEEGLWPSRVATSTYLEDPGVGLPVLSLVVDPPDLFDEETGIYVYGSTEYETWYPYFGANFWEEWERDLHVELWEPDGTLAFSQDAGIQIAGGWSRAFAQRNFELLARTAYGPETFDHPVFPDEDIDSFHRLYLRNGGDWCSTQIVDGTVQALLRDGDGRRLAAYDAQAYRPVLVYLNGQFWGLYELKERLDEWYDADHHDVDPDALDRVEVGWTHQANWELMEGDWDAFDALEDLATTRSLADDDAWADFAEQVDVTNFAAQSVAENWIANGDWGTNNLRMWRPHTDDGRWRWMVYDFGHGWPSASADYLAIAASTSSKGMRFSDALENDAFRALVLNAHGDLLNTTMAGDAAAETVERLAEEVRPAMPMQRERWCGGADTSAFESAVAYAASFARARGAAMDAQLVARFAPGGHASLSVDAEGEGTVRLTTIEVEPGFSGTYYAGAPMTVTAVPADGWVFDAWEDGGDDPVRVLPMDGDTAVTARFGPAP